MPVLGFFWQVPGYTGRWHACCLGAYGPTYYVATAEILDISLVPEPKPDISGTQKFGFNY